MDNIIERLHELINHEGYFDGYEDTQKIKEVLEDACAYIQKHEASQDEGKSYSIFVNSMARETL